MTPGEQNIVDVLTGFLQRELDLIRRAMDDARREQAEDHHEVKKRLGVLETGQAKILVRLGALETHEEADRARAEGALAERERREARNAKAARTAAGVLTGLGVVVAIVFAVVDHLV